ncbi:MAG: 4'-phosphopantetheinyl transferase superfamily protein [Desulfomonile sp.]|nr:4'-phosphopantetheinyl transferase superfamily protein [Desulfomonile sp.]
MSELDQMSIDRSSNHIVFEIPHLLTMPETAPYIMASCVRRTSRPDERHTAKKRLVLTLLQCCNREVSPGGNISGKTQSLQQETRLGADTLGRPLLFLKDRRGPSVSFTHLGLKTWAVLAIGSCAVGIDAASGSEFSGDYPFHRAFAAGELEAAVMSLTDGVVEAAAAAWSAKEAAVKALGCGFRLADPLDVQVGQWSGSASRFTSKVSLSGRAAQRFSFARSHLLRVSTVREDDVWVSVAVIVQHF